MRTEATNEETLVNKFKTALIGAVAVGTALLGAAPAQADTAQDPAYRNTWKKADLTW